MMVFDTSQNFELFLVGVIIICFTLGLPTSRKYLENCWKCMIERLKTRSKAIKYRKSESAFMRAAPDVWNKLPLPIRSIKNADVFKTELKTHYFRQVYA